MGPVMIIRRNKSRTHDIYWVSAKGHLRNLETLPE
jgi:hypothetical protein